MLRILLCITLLIISQLALAFSYTLEITEQELQDKVSAMMPMEKKKYFVTVRMFDPEVDLSKESNEIGVFTNIEVITPGGFRSTGRANIKGTLSYDSEKGAFYFHNPTIVSLEVDKLPEKFSPKVKKITQLAVTKAMSVYPIYKFKDNKIKHKLAKAVLESIAVKNESLHVTLSAF
jgi:Protein of unknown function (DUF1439)